MHVPNTVLFHQQNSQLSILSECIQFQSGEAVEAGSQFTQSAVGGEIINKVERLVTSCDGGEPLYLWGTSIEVCLYQVSSVGGLYAL